MEDTGVTGQKLGHMDWAAVCLGKILYIIELETCMPPEWSESGQL